MKDFNGNLPRAMNLGIVSLDEFTSTYNKQAEMEGVTVKASTLFPMKTTDGGMMFADKDCKIPLFTAVIYYNFKGEDKRTLESKPEETPAPKIEKPKVRI